MTKSKRLLITLSANAYKLLEEALVILGVSSKAEVIRNALTLYFFTLEKKVEEGYDLCLIKGDEVRVIEYPGLLPKTVLNNKNGAQKGASGVNSSKSAKEATARN